MFVNFIIWTSLSDGGKVWMKFEKVSIRVVFNYPFYPLIFLKNEFLGKYDSYESQTYRVDL